MGQSRAETIQSTNPFNSSSLRIATSCLLLALGLTTQSTNRNPSQLSILTHFKAGVKAFGLSIPGY